MNNNVQVNLQFTANTSQAKQELANLQTQLTSLINQPVPIGAKMTAEIQQATVAAAELKVHLQNATNVKTGALDFGKLNQSIKQSGMSLSEYGAKLQALGPQGQQAFMQLANSVAAAEVPIRRSSAALTGMLTTFKNTAKWMVSSTVLNGFIRTMSSAYGYAQDLNESLNNIRIVTGYNIDQMSKFAAEANKAAKALNATTTEYTNASLIYYQQGLSDEQVKQRTDVTIKLANVSRQAAETVSDQMTAVWNNFYDGSKSLEYYADALTALGAATASSTDEIAQGLEKFAAIADTVGLSYEYATAALATVTAQTRQSADVVGTAFKTLFARIQDLKLGETLDDGTTLGTYSEALARVGINIKDASGSLKDMDDILNEMGSKWNQLDKDQQVALAKSVAGVRQYAQLVALMDNWDFMKENLKTVENSTGTLQKQADIYAESWEAASDRVRASAEKVYSALLNDKFFISLNNGLAGVLDSIGSIVKGMGGLKGVISMLGVIVTKVFASQIANGLKNITYNLVSLTTAGRKAVQTLKQQEMEAMKSQLKSYEGNSIVDKTMTEAYQEQIGAQQKIMENAEHMSEIEKQIAQTILDQGKALADNAVKYANIRKAAEQQASATAGDIYGMTDQKQQKGVDLNTAGKQMGALKAEAHTMGEIKSTFLSMAQGAKLTDEEFNKLIVKINSLSKASTETKERIASFANEMHNTKDDSAELGLQFGRLQAELKEFTNSTLLSEGEVKELAAALKIPDSELGTLKEKLQQYVAAQEKAGKATAASTAELDKSKAAFENAGKAAENAKGKVTGWADGVTAMASSLMSVSMMLSSINSLMDTLTDPDTSGWDKFLAVLSSVGMTAMSVISLIGSLAVIKSAFKKKDTEETNKNTAANIANSQSEDMVQKETTETAGAKKVKTKAMQQDTGATLTNGAEGTYKGRAVKYNEKAKRWTWNDGKKGQGKFATGNTGKVTMAGAETATTAGGFGSALGTIAGVAGGLAVAAISIYAMSEYLNKHNAEAQKAAETAQELAKGYENAKTAYDDMLSTSSNYQSAVSNLATLTKGTLEYREAILKANDEALKLIQNNKDLAYSIGDDGLIIIDEESMQALQEKQLKALQIQQSAAMSGSIKSQKAQLDADSIEFRRDVAKGKDGIGGEGDVAQLLGSIGAGAGVGAAIGSVIPVIGTAIGAAVGALVGTIGGLIWDAADNDATNAEQKALEDLAKAYREQGDLALTEEAIRNNLTINDQALRDSLAENADETAEMVKQMVQLEDATRANTLALSKQMYGDDVGPLLTKLVGEKTSEISENIKTVFDEDTTRVSDYDTNDTVKDIADRYAKAVGKKIDWVIDDTVMKDDDQFYFQYQEVIDGKLETLTVSIDAMAETIAQAEAADDIQQTAEKYDEAVQNATKKLGDNFIDNITNALLENKEVFGSELTQENLEKIQQLGSNTSDLNKFWKQNFGMSLQEYLRYTDYASAEAFAKELEKYTKVATDTLRDTINSVAPDIRSSFKELLDIGQLAQVTEQGKTDLARALNDIVYEESPELAETLLNNLQTMTPEAIAAFTQTLSSQGLRASAEDFNAQFKEIAKGMNLGEDEISSFMTVWEDFSLALSRTTEDIASHIAMLNSASSGWVGKEDIVKYIKGPNASADSISDKDLQEKYGLTTKDGKWYWDSSIASRIREQLIGEIYGEVLEGENNLTRTGQIAGASSDLYGASNYAYSMDPNQAKNEADAELEAILESFQASVANDPNIDFRLVPILDGTETRFGPSQDLIMRVNVPYTVNGLTYDNWHAFNAGDLLSTPVLNGKGQPMNYNDAKLTGEAGSVEEWARLIMQSTLFDGQMQTNLAWYRNGANGVYYRADDNDGFGATQVTVNPGQGKSSAEAGKKAYYDSYYITNEEAVSQKARAILDLIQMVGLGNMGIDWPWDDPEGQLSKIEKEPSTYLTKDDQASEFNNIYQQVIDNLDSYQAIIDTNRNNVLEDFIQSLYNAGDLSGLAEIGSNGTYNGTYLSISSTQQQKALSLSGGGSIDIANLGETGNSYVSYLQESGRGKLHSSLFEQKDGFYTQTALEKTRELAAYVLKIQKAFTELQDADYSNLFETLYSGAFNTLSPEYSSAKAEFTKFAGELLSLDNEDIDLIALFANETNQALLDSLMSGQIGYEEFLASITKNYAQANIVGLEEFDNQFTKRLDSFKIGQEASEGFLENLNNWLTATGNTAQDVNNYLEMQGYRVETNAKGEITYISKLGAELVNFNQYLEDNLETLDKLSKIDVVERYKEVNDQLDDLKDKMDDASKAADRLYGKARLNQMAVINNMLANEVELLKYKRNENEQYLAIDQAELQRVAKEKIGTEFDIDENTGLIRNYHEVMEEAYRAYSSYYESAKAGGFDEYEQDRLEDYEESLNAVKDVISQYDETREALEDVDNEIQAALYQMQDNNYEQFTYTIDMELEIRDLKLQLNQYNLDKVMTDLLEAGAAGDFERLMEKRLDLSVESRMDKVNKLEEEFNKGQKAFEILKSDQAADFEIIPENMGISQADYAKGLKDQLSATYENIEAIKEYDNLMSSYYGDTLAAANEEIEKYVSLMTEASSVLDHYKNLMELTGKKTNYKAIGTILEGQAIAAQETLNVSKAISESRKADADFARQTYEEAVAAGADETVINSLKNTWLTAEQAANEAQEKMLSDTEAWAETQNAILENALLELGRSYEEIMTGGTYADLQTAMNRASSSQEEYLTTTNKIYELNKLINKAQQDIDKTSNTVAKRRLDGYVKETEQLQKRAKFSNFELEIQQAKYDLLLAEIALEEAQNAKSTVRLQRDATGNFGYVYTADQNAIDDAQQKMEDAENRLYNIRLKGANDYAQKALQIQMEFLDTMKELETRRQEGDFASQQAYDQAVLEAKNYYYNKLAEYSNLYGVAISEDIRIAEDAWSTEFASMVTSVERWNEQSTKLIEDVGKAFLKWEENLSPLYNEGGVLYNIEQKVANTKSITEGISQILLGTDGESGIVAETNEAVKEALNLATEYGKIRDTLMGDKGILAGLETELTTITGMIDSLSEMDDTTVNVNQTMKYVVDATAFNGAVSIFSDAVNRFNNQKQGDSGPISYDIISDKWTEQEREAWLAKHGDDSIRLANSDYEVNAWTRDGNKLTKTDLTLSNSQLSQAKIIGKEYIDGQVMLGISVGGKTYYVPFSWITIGKIPDMTEFYRRMGLAGLDSYDTGGYTGEWGPEGRLAILHQKELVLNAEDTSNLLMTLGLLDNIMATLDRYTISAQLGGLLSSPIFSMNSSGIIDQNVHIEASFPNVQDRNEIEEALNNLVNKASQYANRK